MNILKRKKKNTPFLKQQDTTQRREEGEYSKTKTKQPLGKVVCMKNPTAATRALQRNKGEHPRKKKTRPVGNQETPQQVGWMFRRRQDRDVASCPPAPPPLGPQGQKGQNHLTWSNFWLNSCSFSIRPGLELSPSVKGFLVTCNTRHPNC